MASESHIKSLPLKENEISELTAAQESTLLFQLPSLLPCSPLVLLLLIVNDFFKCEAGSPAFPTLHILATFQDVNRRLSQKLGLGPALCVDVVRMGEGARRRESVPSTAQTFNLRRGFDRVRDRAREEHAWPASNEAADAKNTESLVGQKELIKVKKKKEGEDTNTEEAIVLNNGNLKST